MRKFILSVGTILLLNAGNAQWTNKVVDNGFDESYKICYTRSNNNAILKLENVDGVIVFYIQGSYFCTETPVVDISFMVNGVWKKYNIIGVKNNQGDALFLVDDLLNDEMYLDFKNCSSVKLRVNEEYCDTDVFQFNMSGSTSALNFISK